SAGCGRCGLNTGRLWKPFVGSAGVRARRQPLCRRFELGQLVGGSDRRFLTEREHQMQNRVKLASAGAVVGGALLAAGGLGLAHAAPPAQSVGNDGKVNIPVVAGGQQVGTLQDVSLTSAEALAVSACPNAGITAEAIRALDVDGTPVPGTCAGAEGGL